MKLELNVVRLNNEDVIATSSNLTATATCYKFADVDGLNTLNVGDEVTVYADGTLLGYGAQPVDTEFASTRNTYLSNAGTTLDFNKYYRLYQDENGKYYLYECKDHSSHQ